MHKQRQSVATLCADVVPRRIDRLEFLLAISRALLAVTLVLPLAVLLSAQTPLSDATKGTIIDLQMQDPDNGQSSSSWTNHENVGGTQTSRLPAATASTSQSKQESEGKQTKRMFWVVPNFTAVSANTQLPPLSPKEKFRLAMQDSFDYSSFAWAGVLSLQSFAMNSNPELGQGMLGYGRYYWRTFTDGVSGTLSCRQTNGDKCKSECSGPKFGFCALPADHVRVYKR